MSAKDELLKSTEKLQDHIETQGERLIFSNQILSSLSKAVLAQGKILEQMLSDSPMPDHNRLLLTPTEVAKLFGVNPKTVTRWARRGKVEAHMTLGGHRRYAITDIRALLKSHSSKATAEVVEDAQVD